MVSMSRVLHMTVPAKVVRQNIQTLSLRTERSDRSHCLMHCLCIRMPRLLQTVDQDLERQASKWSQGSLGRHRLHRTLQVTALAGIQDSRSCSKGSGIIIACVRLVLNTYVAQSA